MHGFKLVCSLVTPAWSKRLTQYVQYVSLERRINVVTGPPKDISIINILQVLESAPMG
jgi:hypothetical protein